MSNLRQSHGNTLSAAHTTKDTPKCDTSTSPSPNGDSVRDIAVLLEMYVQDLTMISIFCQHITKYSFKIIYFSPDLVLRQVPGTSSTTVVIDQLLSTLMDLNSAQLSEYILLLNNELQRRICSLPEICAKIDEKSILPQSNEERVIREKMAALYTRDIQEVGTLIREKGFHTVDEHQKFFSNGNVIPFIISTTFIQALRYIFNQKCQKSAEELDNINPDSSNYTLPGESEKLNAKATRVKLAPEPVLMKGSVLSVIARKERKSSANAAPDQSKQSGNTAFSLSQDKYRLDANDAEVEELLAQLLSENECLDSVPSEDVPQNTDADASAPITQREVDSLKILELAEEVKMLTVSLDSKDERLSVLEQELLVLRAHTQKLEQEQTELIAELTFQRKEASENATLVTEKTNELNIVSKELGIKLSLLKKAAAEISRLKELLTQSTDTVEFSSSKITELQNELEIKDTEIRRHEDRLERLRTELAERTKSLHNLELVEVKLRQDLEEVKNGLERTASRTTELEHTLAQKTIQLDRKSEELTLLMNENAKFSSQIIALSNSTNTLKLEVEQLRLERNTSHGDVNRLSAELTQKEIDLCDALKKLELETEKLTKIEENLSEKRLQIEKLTLNLTLKSNEIAKLNAELLAKTEEICCKTKTIQHLHGEIETLHAKLLDNSSSQARIAEVQELLTTADHLKAKVYDLESLNTELQNDGERYRLEINRLSLALEEKDKSIAQISGSTERKLKLISPLSHSHGQDVIESSTIGDLSGSFDERMEHMHSSWRNLQSVLDATEKEKQELVVRFQEAQVLIRTLHTQLKQQTNSKDNNNQVHQVTKESCSDSGTNSAKLEQKINTLQDELAATKAKNKSLREALNSLKVAYKALLENMNETTTLLNDQTVREEEHKKKIVELTAELSVLRASQMGGNGALDMETLSHEYTVVSEELKRTVTELSEAQAALRHSSAREEALLERLTNVAASSNLNQEESDNVGTKEVAVQITDSPWLSSLPHQVDVSTNTEVQVNYREAKEVEKEISEMHSTIASLTCELVQLRGEYILLKQQSMSNKNST